MSSNLPARLSKTVAGHLARVEAIRRARVAFVIDATWSRSQTWDLAASMTAPMFDEAARLGGLSAQLCYWLGNEFKFTEWTVGAHELAARMHRIQCVSGKTKFNDAFTHIRSEHARAPIAAVIIIGDAVEENAHGLVDSATGLPGLFLFQENDNLVEFPGSDGMTVEQVFRRLADVTKGFYAKFDSSSASQLSGWLRATVVYATGGLKALEGRRDAESVKLLQHLKQ